MFGTTAYVALEALGYYDDEDDTITSAAHSVWTSSQRVNKILNKAYAQSGGHVAIFFSVILGSEPFFPWTISSLICLRPC
jgi:hypothetical protein